MNQPPKKIACIGLMCALIGLQGCAALVVGAGVGAASAAHDRRTLGTQLDDKTSTARISSTLRENLALDDANIDITVFNGIVLLVGQAPSNAIKTAIDADMAKIPHIRKIHNQLRIGEPIPASVATNDLWLDSKVKAALLGDERVDGLHIKVVVEDSEVFLMGIVSQQESETAIDIARYVNGVARVVNAFEIR